MPGFNCQIDRNEQFILISKVQQLVLIQCCMIQDRLDFLTFDQKDFQGWISSFTRLDQQVKTKLEHRQRLEQLEPKLLQVLFLDQWNP